VKRLLPLFSPLREFLEVIGVVLKVHRLVLKVHRAVLKVLPEFLKVLRSFLKVLRSFLKVLPEFLKVLSAVLKVLPEFLKVHRHLCDLQCEVSQLRGELGRFDGWRFNTRGRNEIEGIVKLIDLPGELAKAKQIEGGHVFEESHAVDRFPFDYPGLFNDLFDLIFGTDYLDGHADNLDRDRQGMSSCSCPACRRCSHIEATSAVTMRLVSVEEKS